MFVQQYNLTGDSCYLVRGQTYASSVSSGHDSSHIQHFNVDGYLFTDKVPPRFDGSDLKSWIKAARYWMDNSTLQEKNKVTSIVNKLMGLATRWMEELNFDIPLLQSPSGLDVLIEKFKSGHVKPGLGAFLMQSIIWASLALGHHH